MRQEEVLTRQMRRNALLVFGVGTAIAIVIGFATATGSVMPIGPLGGIVSIALWFAFARWCVKVGMPATLGALFGATTGFASAAVTWAVASRLGSVAPEWGGEFCNTTGLSAGMLTWPIVGVIACASFRAHHPAAQALALFGVLVVAFLLELQLSAACK